VLVVQRAPASRLDRAERAVLDPQGPLVAEEIKPVAARKRLRAAFALDEMVAAELFALAPPGARKLSQLTRVVAGVGEYEAALLGPLCSVLGRVGASRKPGHEHE
jgi:hypothetical protein